ncbi:MAG: hypothetical protein ABSB33_03600 [Tepidisphaeraceae bacterium]|jgi:hypothetical protein
MPVPKRSLKPENDPAERSTFLRRYTWIIIKNVVGWVLMLSAIAVGGVFPIPLGTPMFVIGFALITLPGKRRITSGALRGIPIKLFTRKARMWRLAISLLLPPAAVWFLAFQRHPIVHPSRMGLWRLCTLYAVAMVAAWILTLLLLLAINAILRIMPRTRRRVRPWLRSHGINLLPPRRKSRNPARPHALDDQHILEFGRGNPLRRGRGKT